MIARTLKAAYALRWLLLLAILAGSAIALWNRKELFEGLTRLSLPAVFAILTAKLFVSYTNAAKFRKNCDLFGANLTFSEWFGLSAVTTFYSYILPAKLCILPRSRYLKTRKQLAYSTQIAMLGGANLLEICLTALSGLLALMLYAQNIAVKSPHVITGFVIVFVLTVAGLLGALFASRLAWRARVHWIDDAIGKLQRGIEVFRGNAPGVMHLTALSFISLLSRTLAMYVCFLAVGYTPDFPAIYLAICLVNLAVVISLTPGNIGVMEGALLTVTTLVGIPLEASVPAAIISRVGSMIVQFGLGILYSYILFGNETPWRDGADTKDG